MSKRTVLITGASVTREPTGRSLVTRKRPRLQAGAAQSAAVGAGGDGVAAGETAVASAAAAERGSPGPPADAAPRAAAGSASTALDGNAVAARAALKPSASLRTRSVAALAPALSGAKRARTRHSSPGARVAPLHSSPASSELVEVGADDRGAVERQRRLAVVADGEGVGDAAVAGEHGRRSRRRRGTASPPRRRPRRSAAPSRRRRRRRRGPGAPASARCSWGTKRTWAVQVAAGASGARLQFSSSRRKLPASPPATMPMKKLPGRLPWLVKTIVSTGPIAADRDRAEVARGRAPVRPGRGRRSR